MVLPYLKGLMVIKKILHIVLVYLLWFFCIQYLVLNKWYQSTFLGQTLWANIFYFCRFFFRRRKKRAATFSKFSVYLHKNLQKRVVYLSSSQKNTQFKKKNRPKRSPGSQDIEVLKSANFQGFFRRTATRFFFFFL
jgi:hypothetical protein